MKYLALIFVCTLGLVGFWYMFAEPIANQKPDEVSIKVFGSET